MAAKKTLLQQIEEESIDPRSDITALLRKCLVLASRLQNPSLKNWVNNELNGYSDIKDLPSYRIVPCLSSGSFRMASAFTKHDVLISQENIPVEFREELGRIDLVESVSILQARVNDGKAKVVSQPWSNKFVQPLAHKIFPNQVLVSANKILATYSLVQVLASIKDRVLRFVLDMEGNCPNAGDAIGVFSADKKLVDQMVTNNIFEGVGNVALQCGTVTQNNTVNVEKGNWDLLETFLREIKIEAEAIGELKSILAEAPPKSKDQFGTRLSKWIGAICAKAANGLYAIPFEVISGVLAGAICKYMGFV